MNIHHDLLRHDGVEHAREILHDAIENPTYQVYAETSGPLTLDDIPTRLRVSDDFEKVVDHFGWPSEVDTEINQVPRIEDDEQFLHAFAARERDLVHLNNFVAWVSQAPRFDQLDFHAPMEQIYGRSPALHRLNAVAPDLAEPARTVLADIRSRTGTHSTDMLHELGLPANRDLLTALNMIYHIAGRLFTRHDKRLQAALLLPGGNHRAASEVTSAFEELIT